ncbi:MAG: SPOR domain-containing protein [Magnetococcales bacterium]|nr:SPOR domain-containing protein [Magnetococcales bacterium]
MKASPNREQFLFLVTGGIILVLILMVVIFNMVRTPGDLIAEKETQPAPKVKVGDRTPDGAKSPWLTQVAPAPIFNPDGAQNKADSKSEPKVEIDAKDLAPQQENNPKEASKTLDKWSSQEASALESSRLESRPLTTGGNAARTPPIPLTPHADSRSGPPPMPKKVGDAPGVRSAPPPPMREPASPSAQDSSRPEDANTALASTPKRQNKGNQKNAPDAEDHEDAEKPLQKPATPPPGGFSVQVASFNDTDHAEALANKLSSLMFDGKRMPVYQNSQAVGKKTVYRVRLGPFPSQARAQQAATLAGAKAGVKGSVIGPGQ